MSIDDPITVLSGVGDKISESLAAKNVITISDLLLYLPKRHEDYSHIISINQIKPGRVTIKARINSVVLRQARRGMTITEAIASDDSSSTKLIWFNQPYRSAGIKSDELYYISGVFKLTNKSFSFINPSIEALSDLPINAARIMPIYSETKNVSSKLIRRLQAQILDLVDQLDDYLPPIITTNFKLLSYSQAIKAMHYPSDKHQLDSAIYRLQFDSLFPILLANELSVNQLKANHSLQVPFKVELAKDFTSKLDFILTDDQRRIIWQIYQDMQKNLPMNRLVEGDVGSGKTVVAVMSAVMAMASGYKAAFMAPTELLARQHERTIRVLLEPLGMAKQLILLCGSMSMKEKKKAIEDSVKNPNCLIVGTHSLLTSGVDWHNLALLIIDEQHRFGVDQRTSIQKQAGHLPHFLSLTATPIPRSLALTLLSDLKLSVLRDKPPQRGSISTRIITPSDHTKYYKELREQLQSGRQAYIVCPYIRPKDKNDYQAAENIIMHYKQKFPKYNVGLIHGQLSSDKQAALMGEFINGKLDILIATTVIEVGVDVANATWMAIYGPERFGLAQLHQLRGRIGRSEHQSYCWLMLNDAAQPISRLRSFTQINDGFKLSELDLELRGPGAIYGKLQHGQGGPSLMSLDNQQLIDTCKRAVRLFFENNISLVEYKSLAQRVDYATHLTYLN